MEGIEVLKQQGFVINAIVCDGRKGLIQSFGNTPIANVSIPSSKYYPRYLTKKPKLRAAQELLFVVDLMKQTDKRIF